MPTRNQAIAAQRSIQRRGYAVLLPARLAFDEGAFLPTARAGGGLVTFEQPVATVHAAPSLAGNADGASGGFVPVQALASAEDVHAHAHGSPLLERWKPGT
ncbi:hypothetical protein D3C80_1588960 [compost metagenome]